MPKILEQKWETFADMSLPLNSLVQALQRPKILEDFKHRCLEIILSPDPSVLPYKVVLPKGKRNLLDDAFKEKYWRKDLSPNDFKTVAGLISSNITYLSGQKNKSSEQDKSILNSLIPDILPELHEADAKKLLESFDPNFIYITNNGFGRLITYDPLKAIFENKYINIKLKAQVAKSLHQQLLTEKPQKQNIKTFIFGQDEPLSHRFSRILDKFIQYKESSDPQLQFAIDELSFLIKNVPQALSAINYETFSKTKNMFNNDKEVKKVFFAHFIQNGQFKVEGEASYQLANEMLDFFPDDPKIYKYILNLINEYEFDKENYKKWEQEQSNNQFELDKKFASLDED